VVDNKEWCLHKFVFEIFAPSWINPSFSSIFFISPYRIDRSLLLNMDIDSFDPPTKFMDVEDAHSLPQSAVIAPLAPSFHSSPSSSSSEKQEKNSRPSTHGRVSCRSAPKTIRFYFRF
jgi:hypothetical protein